MLWVGTQHSLQSGGSQTCLATGNNLESIPGASTLLPGPLGDFYVSQWESGHSPESGRRRRQKDPSEWIS